MTTLTENDIITLVQWKTVFKKCNYVILSDEHFFVTNSFDTFCKF